MYPAMRLQEDPYLNTANHSVLKQQGLAYSLYNGFEPGSWSVICGRGRECYNNTGNKRLRVLVESKLEAYQRANRTDRSHIVTSLMSTIRDAAKIGCFIKYDSSSQRWYEVSDEIAREKIGQLIRERITQRDPSKLAMRKEKRKAMRQKLLQRRKSSQKPGETSSIKESTSNEETSS